MSRLKIVITGLAAAAVLAGCKTVPVGTQKVVESSGGKPGWTVKIPKTKGGKAYFRGLRSNAPTQEGATTDARQHAARQVAEMVQTDARVDYESARYEEGIAKDDTDVGTVIKDGLMMLSKAMVQGVKEEESYFEKIEEKTVSGVTYRYNWWMLVSITEEDYKRVANMVIGKQLEKAKKEKNEKAAKFLERMRENVNVKKYFQEE